MNSEIMANVKRCGFTASVDECELRT